MPGATRDPWLDNAKMALVTLVVIGHAWTLLPQTTLNNHVYDFLYAWHIPAFVFVTGYLSRGFTYTQQRFWQLFRTIIVPSAAPQVLVGLRQSLAIAWLTLIVAEQINADKGIGYLINNARDFLRIDIIIFGLIVYALLGIGTDAIVRALELRALRYRT